MNEIEPLFLEPGRSSSYILLNILPRRKPDLPKPNPHRLKKFPLWLQLHRQLKKREIKN